MHPIYPFRPRRAAPDLAAAEPDQAAPMTPPRQPRSMVHFTDGSWVLCRVRNWQQQRDRWLVRLGWGDRGTIRDGWYVHDPEHVTGPPADSPDLQRAIPQDSPGDNGTHRSVRDPWQFRFKDGSWRDVTALAWWKDRDRRDVIQIEWSSPSGGLRTDTFIADPAKMREHPGNPNWTPR